MFSIHLLFVPVTDTSKTYLNVVLDALSNRCPEHAQKYTCIKSNLGRGKVWETGFNFYRKKWYTGIFFQAQSFSLTSMPQLLIENLAPEKVASVA